MLITYLRTLWAEFLLRWQGVGELPGAADDDEQPHWYELPNWC